LKNTTYTTSIGLFLFFAYLMQEFLQLKWDILEELQTREIYKRWSGLAVGLFILFQWLLTWSRIIPGYRKKALTLYKLHKWIGVFSPVLLYVHSTKFGFGYLALFSCLFLGNMLLGTLNLEVIKTTKSWLFKGWMVAHVAISVCITILLFFHITLVFYYK
jgi:sulfoxide reductase heme-binding subunit YedZ